MTVKVKAVRSGWAGAGAEEPSPGVEAGSCSGNPAPAPNGPTTSLVGRKGRLKTTRAGQRTEKRRTIYNPQLSRGRSDGSPCPGERGRWEDGWWGAKQRSLKIAKIPPLPPHQPAAQNPTTARILQPKASLALRPTGQRRPAEEPGVRPGSWAEHNTLGFSCVSHLLLVCGVGAGVGRGERYLDFGLFPIRNRQFCSYFHLELRGLIWWFSISSSLSWF